MKLPYYMQQRLTKRAIDLVMVIMLIVTLFPIFWMVFSSFKSNTEILLGKIPFGKAPNDAVQVIAKDKYLFVLTADGGVNKFERQSGKLIDQTSIRSMATAYLPDDQHVWIGSADKGLVQVSLDEIGKKRSFSVNEQQLDINKVISTVLAGDDKSIWMGWQQRGLEKIVKFDKNEMRFTGSYSVSSSLSPSQLTTATKIGGTLWIGTNKGLLSFDTQKNYVSKAYDTEAIGMPLTDITRIVPVGGDLMLSTLSGIYRFSVAKGKVIGKYDVNSGLLSDRVNSVIVENGRLFAGTNRGLSIINLADGNSASFEKVFSPVKGSKEKGFVGGDVFGMARYGDEIYLGSSGGRISAVSLASKGVDKSFLAKEGHTLVRWRNYVDLWKNIDFGLYLKNSLIICGITMFLAMIFATLAAYALARFNFPGNQFFSIGVLATQMIPSIMYLIPLYIMFTKFTQLTGVPMKGTYVGLILIYSAFFIPFSIWILRGFFAAIPVELEEAARIDGCSSFQVFWYIVLPLAVPGIIATGIYVFLTAWDELMFAWVLTNADTMTIPVGIRLFVGNYQNRFDLMMAAATVATIPVMVLFFMLQKHIVKGLTAGAVKG